MTKEERDGIVNSSHPFETSWMEDDYRIYPEISIVDQIQADIAYQLTRIADALDLLELVDMGIHLRSQSPVDAIGKKIESKTTSTSDPPIDPLDGKQKHE